LSRLDADLDLYNRTLLRIFSIKLTKNHDCVRYFGDLLLATSKLYLYHLTLKDLTKVCREANSDTEFTRHSGKEVEIPMRKRLTTRLETLLCPPRFVPYNAFADENQLRRIQDFQNNLRLHLPEIYGESVSLLHLVRQLRAARAWSRQAVIELLVGLDHLAFHASYVRHAREIVSAEISWEAPLREIVCLRTFGAISVNPSPRLTIGRGVPPDHGCA
jgi:hypothetical protein